MPVNEKTEKFDCIAQQIADVMSAVEKIKPVVALIREVDTQGTDVETLKEEIKNFEKDIQIMLATISEMSEESRKKDLSGLLGGYTAEHAAKKAELEALMKQCETMKEQIEEYLRYANSFHYVSTEAILLDLFGKAISEECSEEEFFSILFILKGEAVEDKEMMKKISHEYANKTTDVVRKGILRFIENYTYDEIRNLILEN